MPKFILKKYKQKEISLGRAAELAGIPLADFIKIAADRKIHLNYDQQDLKRDFIAVQDNDF